MSNARLCLILVYSEFTPLDLAHATLRLNRYRPTFDGGTPTGICTHNKAATWIVSVVVSSLTSLRTGFFMPTSVHCTNHCTYPHILWKSLLATAEQSVLSLNSCAFQRLERKATSTVFCCDKKGYPQIMCTSLGIVLEHNALSRSPVSLDDGEPFLSRTTPPLKNREKQSNIAVYPLSKPLKKYAL